MTLPIGVSVVDGFVLFDNVGIVPHSQAEPASWFAVRRAKNKDTIFGGDLLMTFDVMYEDGSIKYSGDMGTLVGDTKDGTVKSVAEFKSIIDSWYGAGNWHIVNDHQYCEYPSGEFDDLSEDEKTVALLNECLTYEKGIVTVPTFHAKVNPFTSKVLFLYFVDGVCYEQTFEYRLGELLKLELAGEKFIAELNYSTELDLSIYPYDKNEPNGFNPYHFEWVYVSVVLKNEF